MVLDADDRLRPDAVRRLRPPLEEDPELAYAYGLIEHVGDWSGVIRFPDYDPFKLLYRPIVGTTWLMRSSAFEQVGGYDPEVTWAEDWDILLRLLEHDRHGRRVPEVAYEYRRHGASKLGNDRGAYRREYRAMRKRHAALYARAGTLAQQSGLGLAGRLTYRLFWAWRPVPRAVENGLYRLVFRRSAALDRELHQLRQPRRQPGVGVVGPGRPRDGPRGAGAPVTSSPRAVAIAGTSPAGATRPDAVARTMRAASESSPSTRIGRSAARYSKSLPVASPRREPEVSNSSPDAARWSSRARGRARVPA